MDVGIDCKGDNIGKGNECGDFIGIGKRRIGLSNGCVPEILGIGRCECINDDEDGNTVITFDSISIGLWK